jgi:hypothetical protein
MTQGNLTSSRERRFLCLGSFGLDLKKIGDNGESIFGYFQFPCQDTSVLKFHAITMDQFNPEGARTFMFCPFQAIRMA